MFVGEGFRVGFRGVVGGGWFSCGKWVKRGNGVGMMGGGGGTGKGNRQVNAHAFVKSTL